MRAAPLFVDAPRWSTLASAIARRSDWAAALQRGQPALRRSGFHAASSPSTHGQVVWASIPLRRLLAGSQTEVSTRDEGPGGGLLTALPAPHVTLAPRAGRDRGHRPGHRGRDPTSLLAQAGGHRIDDDQPREPAPAGGQVISTRGSGHSPERRRCGGAGVPDPKRAGPPAHPVTECAGATASGGELRRPALRRPRPLPARQTCTELVRPAGFDARSRRAHPRGSRDRPVVFPRR